MSPEQYRAHLRRHGWTVENLRERMAGCRKGIREIDRAKPAAWSYRFLFAGLYCRYRRDPAILST